MPYAVETFTDESLSLPVVRHPISQTKIAGCRIEFGKWLKAVRLKLGFPKRADFVKWLQSQGAQVSYKLAGDLEAGVRTGQNATVEVLLQVAQALGAQLSLCDARDAYPVELFGLANTIEGLHAKGVHPSFSKP